MNVKNILCPVDFSAGSEAAVAHATSLAKEHDAELHLVYSYEEPLAYADGAYAGVTVAGEMDRDKRRLLDVVPKGYKRYRHEFLMGSPAPTLLDYVNKNDIDMIVMGTHGRTGLGRLLMGSVAEAVVRKAPCPVLTVKKPLETAASA